MGAVNETASDGTGRLYFRLNENVPTLFRVSLVLAGKMVRKNVMTPIWRIPPHFASGAFLKKRFLSLFLEMPHPSHEIPVAEHLAWHDSLAHYASLTTFRHIMVHSMTFA